MENLKAIKQIVCAPATANDVFKKMSCHDQCVSSIAGQWMQMISIKVMRLFSQFHGADFVGTLIIHPQIKER